MEGLLPYYLRSAHEDGFNYESDEIEVEHSCDHCNRRQDQQKSVCCAICWMANGVDHLILAEIHALVGDLRRFDVAARHRQRVPAPGIAQVEGIGLVPGRPGLS